MKGRVIATEFYKTDYIKVTEGIGCKGYRVTKPKEIAPALREAMKSKVPSIIDIIVSREENIYEKILYSPE